MASNKQTAQRLLEQLQSRSGSQEVQLIKDWLKVQLEDVKNDLLFSTPENFGVLQGEARALHKLIRQLERPNLNQIKAERV